MPVAQYYQFYVVTMNRSIQKTGVVLSVASDLNADKKIWYLVKAIKCLTGVVVSVVPDPNADKGFDT